MPKKVVSKTKGETYYKCIHCGDEIFWNTGLFWRKGKGFINEGQKKFFHKIFPTMSGACRLLTFMA